MVLLEGMYRKREGMSALTIQECAEVWAEANQYDSESLGLRWKVAPTAADVYWTPRTAELAEALGVKEDTIHNLVKAHWMYEYLCLYGDKAQADEAKSKHGYMRFAAMWKKHERYEFDPGECLEFINSDTSNDGMEALVEEIHNPRPEWQRRFDNKQARKWLDKIATEPAPEQSRKITRAAQLLRGRIEAEQ